MILKKGKCDDYLPGYHARRRMKNKIWTCLIILTIAAVNVSCNSETECKHIDSQVTSKEAQSKDFQSENFEIRRNILVLTIPLINTSPLN